MGRAGALEQNLSRHDLPVPVVDIAFRVVATQGEQQWNLGVLRLKDVFELSSNAFIPVYGQRTPIRLGPDNVRIWDQPTPDFDQPVSVTLVPDPELAWESFDMTAIFGETIELSAFEIVRTEVHHRALRSQSELAPAPILDE